MQNAFVEPGGPIEVAAVARRSSSRSTAWPKAAASSEIPVIWIRSHHPRTAATGGHFFDHFVRPGAPGGGGRAPVGRRPRLAVLPGDGRPGRGLHRHQEPLLVLHPGLVEPGAAAAEPSAATRSSSAGTKTNVCVESTARDGMMIDFRVVVLSDATATLSDEEHQASLNVLIQEFADILTVDEVLERAASQRPEVSADDGGTRAGPDHARDPQLAAGRDQRRGRDDDAARVGLAGRERGLRHERRADERRGRLHRDRHVHHDPRAVTEFDGRGHQQRVRGGARASRRATSSCPTTPTSGRAIRWTSRRRPDLRRRRARRLDRIDRAPDRSRRAGRGPGADRARPRSGASSRSSRR